MLQWKQRLLVRYIQALEWFLGIASPVDDKYLEQWLADNWQHRGFRTYVQKRDFKFLKELAGGGAMIELQRDDYVRKLGQRVELLYLAKQSKAAFEKRMKDK